MRYDASNKQKMMMTNGGGGDATVHGMISQISGAKPCVLRFVTELPASVGEKKGKITNSRVCTLMHSSHSYTFLFHFLVFSCYFHERIMVDETVFVGISARNFSFWIHSHALAIASVCNFFFNWSGHHFQSDYRHTRLIVVRLQSNSSQTRLSYDWK